MYRNMKNIRVWVEDILRSRGMIFIPVNNEHPHVGIVLVHNFACNCDRVEIKLKFRLISKTKILLIFYRSLIKL